jgi:hypothetical protein
MRFPWEDVALQWKRRLVGEPVTNRHLSERCGFFRRFHHVCWCGDAWQQASLLVSWRAAKAGGHNLTGAAIAFFLNRRAKGPIRRSSRRSTCPCWASCDGRIPYSRRGTAKHQSAWSRLRCDCILDTNVGDKKEMALSDPKAS